jgi:hypothetical protein
VAAQVRLGISPRPRLGRRERPQAGVERPHARPHPADLLLTGPEDILRIPEAALQREAVRYGFEDVGRGCRGVGAEECAPPLRLVLLHHSDRAGRLPSGDERLVPLPRRLALQGERPRRPPTPLPAPLGQIDLPLAVDAAPAPTPRPRGGGQGPERRVLAEAAHDRHPEVTLPRDGGQRESGVSFTDQGEHRWRLVINGDLGSAFNTTMGSA